MTREEFREWLSHHRAAFTGLSAWIAKLPEPGRQREGEPTRADVLAAWYAVLRHCELSDAREATDRMAAGQIEEPRGWDRHKTTIAQEARRLAAERNRHRSTGAGTRPRYAEGEPTYRCRECLDSGVIPIWHPVAVTAACATLDGAERGQLGQPFTLYEAAARCSCQAGHEYPVLPEYDANAFCRIDLTESREARKESLLAWTEEHRKIPVHDAFAQFA